MLQHFKDTPFYYSTLGRYIIKELIRPCLMQLFHEAKNIMYVCFWFSEWKTFYKWFVLNFFFHRKVGKTRKSLTNGELYFVRKWHCGYSKCVECLSEHDYVIMFTIGQLLCVPFVKIRRGTGQISAALRSVTYVLTFWDFSLFYGRPSIVWT